MRCNAVPVSSPYFTVVSFVLFCSVLVGCCLLVMEPMVPPLCISWGFRLFELLSGMVGGYGFLRFDFCLMFDCLVLSLFLWHRCAGCRLGFES